MWVDVMFLFRLFRGVLQIYGGAPLPVRYLGRKLFEFSDLRRGK
jgi:hypothetical protein